MIMDIYRYLTKDDADHCRELEYEFNSLETAAIIDSFPRLPLKEKHTLYREIISDYPDMPVASTENIKAKDSLHVWLKDIIDYEERAIEAFFTPGDDVMYYCVVYKDGEKCRHSNCFRTAREAIQTEMEEVIEDADKARNPFPEKYCVIHNAAVVNKMKTPRNNWQAFFNVENELFDIEMYTSPETDDVWKDCPDRNLRDIYVPI
jgi:hypothetical protein